MKQILKKHRSICEIASFTLRCRNRFLHRKQARSFKFPQNLNVELTNRCNLNCLYCGREYLIPSSRTEGDISFSLAEKVIQEFETITCHSQTQIQVTPVGLGEPLLYPRFFEVVSLIRHRMGQARIGVTTNGTCLNDGMIKKIVHSELDSILVSINLWSKDLYRIIHKVDQFDRVLMNTTKLVKARKDRKPMIKIQLLDIAINQESINKFLDYWEPLRKENMRFHIRRFIPRSKDVLQLYSEEDRNRYEEMLGMEDVKLKKKRFPCPQLFDTLSVNREGYVFPCCYGLLLPNDTDLCLGNIEETSIKSLYSPKAKIHDLRKLHLEGKYDEIEGCGNCTQWIHNENIFFSFLGRWI